VTDFYSEYAALLLGIPIEEVTKVQRLTAKNMAFKYAYRTYIAEPPVLQSLISKYGSADSLFVTLDGRVFDSLDKQLGF
jgi:hypothetical protein